MIAMPLKIDLANPATGRVMENRIGLWPEVYATDAGYMLKANFRSPARVYRANRTAFLTGLCAYLLLLLVWQGDEAMAVIAIPVAVVVMFIARPFLSRLNRVTLTMHFEGGGANWTGPRRRRHRIDPGADFQAAVLPQHRLAPEEQRIISEIVRERGKPPPVIWGVASEIVIYTGLHRSVLLPVAEIRNDEDKQVANRLRAAIQTVMDQDRADIIATRARQGRAGARKSYDE